MTTPTLDAGDLLDHIAAQDERLATALVAIENAQLAWKNQVARAVAAEAKLAASEAECEKRAAIARQYKDQLASISPAGGAVTEEGVNELCAWLRGASTRATLPEDVRRRAGEAAALLASLARENERLRQDAQMTSCGMSAHGVSLYGDRKAIEAAQLWAHSHEIEPQIRARATAAEAARDQARAALLEFVRIDDEYYLQCSEGGQLVAALDDARRIVAAAPDGAGEKQQEGKT